MCGDPPPMCGDPPLVRGDNDIYGATDRIFWAVADSSRAGVRTGLGARAIHRPGAYIKSRPRAALVHELRAHGR